MASTVSLLPGQERAKAAKEKKKAKQKVEELEAVRLWLCLLGKLLPRTRPKFGEVVQRPPSFSKDSLKSLPEMSKSSALSAGTSKMK